MSFDAASFLASHDPNVSYKHQRLTGGIVNTTVRASKCSPDTSSGRYPQHGSIILKHAAPYIAAIGPSAPFDVQRQTVEAAALQLFNIARRATGNSELRLTRLVKDGEVDVPEFHFHDQDAHVLIMADLGDRPNLSEVFSDLGGLPPNEKANDSLAARLPRTTQSKPYFERLGHELGTFFAELHSHPILEEVQVLLRQHDLTLENITSKPFIAENVVGLLVGHLDRVPDLLQPGEAQRVYEAVRNDFWRQDPPDELSFALGDCWPASRTY